METELGDLLPKIDIVKFDNDCVIKCSQYIS